MSTPDLPMRERIAEALAHARCRETNPKADHPIFGYAMFSEDQREHLRSQQYDAADAVLDLWADLPDTAVEAGARTLTEPEPIPGAKTLGCARHHRVIFNNGCPACNKEAHAILTATIAAFKEGKA